MNDPSLPDGAGQRAEITNEVPAESWPHAPVHRLAENGTFFVTVGTYLKEHHFRGAARLGVLCRGLLRVSSEFGWHLEAWAVFSNHYHFVGHSPVSQDSAESLSTMLGTLHEKTAKWIDRIDGAPGRKVWHNFRETRLTYEKSYFARLNYTHHNAVKHGLVQVAKLYPWCSAGWFEQTATVAQVQTIYEFKMDRLNVYDEYEPTQEW
jgi:putative transposase